MPLPPPRRPRLLMKVWDGPIRLFHWAITLLVLVSYLTYRFDRLGWHMLSGYTILALLLFRLAWGFVGSDTARFSSFLGSPLAGLAHLRTITRREPDDQIGHNAAGGWMVLALLLSLLLQTGTGLFANDEIMNQGPLSGWVGDSTSHWLTRIHVFNFNILLGLIGLHVLFVLIYAAIKGQNLLRPMITGKKRLLAATRQPRLASPALAALILLCAAGLVWALVRFA